MKKKETMKILALDMATKTGWSYHSETLETSGVWDLSIRKDESGGMRLIRFEAKLKEILNGPGVDLIVFESVNVGRSAKANMDGVKLGSKLQAIVERLVQLTDGLECRAYHHAEIKKHAIPKEGAKRNKETMLRAARMKWDEIEIISDDHADALWLLDLARKEYH